MRRYTISVNDQPYEIEVRALDADSYAVRLGDRDIVVRVDEQDDLPRARIAPGVEASSAPRPATPAPVLAAAPAAERPVPQAPRPAAAARPASSGDLTAPMPGVVLTVDARPGARLQRGDPVLVLEAMKMKNALRAPGDVVVAEVLVTEGQQVAYGEPLVTFEKA